MTTDGELRSVSKSLQRQVDTLAETTPARYGLLASYYESVHKALESCSRNYPSTKQLHDSLSESAISPQMLGNLLSLLVELK